MWHGRLGRGHGRDTRATQGKFVQAANSLTISSTDLPVLPFLYIREIGHETRAPAEALGTIKVLAAIA